MHGRSYQYRNGFTKSYIIVTIVVHAHVLVVSHACVIHVTSHVVVRVLHTQGTLVHGPPHPPSDKRVALIP